MRKAEAKTLEDLHFLSSLTIHTRLIFGYIHGAACRVGTLQSQAEKLFTNMLASH